MEKPKKIVNDQVELSPEQKKEQFYKEYIKLCESYELVIQVLPVLTPRDDGSFSIVQRTSIIPLPNAKTE